MQLNEQQLADAARRLRIPVPLTEILEQVLSLEGTMLVRSVEEALKGQTRAQLYLRGVLLACHESTQERLKRARIIVPPIATLVAIGKAEGADFGLRVKEWEESQFGDGDTARYVRLTIARVLEQTKGQVQPTPVPRGAGAPTAVAVPGTMGYRPNRENCAPYPAPAPSEDPQDQRQPEGRRAEPARQHRDEPPLDHGMPPEPPDDYLPSERRTRSRQEDQADGQEPEYVSQHIYGGRAAACFSADITRGGTHTVRLEAAESSATRQYDWQGKIGIQLSQRELPLVLAVFMQWLPKFEGKGHGENNSKWFTLENQGNKLFLSVNAKGRSPRAIPIMPGDGYAVTTLLIRQMLKNDPFLSPEILLSLVRKEALLAGGQATQSQRHAA